MANEKILVVDDDTNICELLRLYLTKEGYQVTTANDGEEGLDKFNQVKPDMVLLDVMMPKMDGLEVCRRIRKLGNTPVMMLTAKGETFDKVLGLELGADDYMVKPFDSKEVVARIKAVLRRCQTSTAAAESTEGVIEFDNLRLDMNSYDKIKKVLYDFWDFAELRLALSSPFAYNDRCIIMFTSTCKERILYEVRYRRSAERRQVHSVQRHHLHQERGSRQLPLLHH